LRRVGLIARSSDCVAFTADSKHLATSRGLDSSIHEIPTGRIVATIGTGTAYTIAFRPDGQQLVLSNGPWIHLFSVPDWRQTALRQVDAPNTVQAIRYTPDGRYLVVGVGRVVQFWNVDMTARVATLTEHAASPISTVALSPNGRFVAAFGGTIVTIWELML
jgi:WD40 repeat protein